MPDTVPGTGGPKRNPRTQSPCRERHQSREDKTIKEYMVTHQRSIGKEVGEQRMEPLLIPQEGGRGREGLLGEASFELGLNGCTGSACLKKWAGRAF